MCDKGDCAIVVVVIVLIVVVVVVVLLVIFGVLVTAMFNDNLDMVMLASDEEFDFLLQCVGGGNCVGGFCSFFGG